MEFKRNNCEVFHQGWNNPLQQYKMARKQICRKEAGESLLVSGSPLAGMASGCISKHVVTRPR